MAATLGNGNITFGDSTTQSTAALPLTGGTLTGALSGTSISTSGNVTVGGDLAVNGNTTLGNAAADTVTFTANRILGDFSNATIANRVMFQTSTVNGNTAVSAAPNGTGNICQLQVYSKSDPTNSSRGDIAVIDGSDIRLASSIIGTGTYLPMTFYTGGSERMRIDTSGNVGIGTSSPGDRLTVSGGNQRIQKDVPELRFRSAGDVNRWYIGANISDSVNGGLHFGSGDGISSGTPRMIIDSSGNVGIGGTPGHKLDVFSITMRLHAGSGNGAGYVQYGSSATTTNNWHVGTEGDGTFRWWNGVYGSGSEKMRIDSSGNVGIGTSSPRKRLHVVAGSNEGTPSFSPETAFIAQNNASAGAWASISIVGGTAGTSRIYFSDKDAEIPAAVVYDHSVNSMYFTTNNNTERMRIDTNGNVSIGTSSSDGRLYVVRPASSAGWLIQSSTSGLANHSGFYQDGSNNVYVEARDRFGNLNVSIKSAGESFINGGNLRVGGAMSVYTSGGDIVQFHQNRNWSTPYWYFNTSGNYGVYSDARLKDNVTNTAQADSVEFIKNLQVVEFNWKPEYGDSTRRISGFLAQNVLSSAKTEGQKNILTNWETYDENDPDCPKMGLSDHRVIPSVVQTLQAALSQIEAQQAIINDLKARLDAANL